MYVYKVNIGDESCWIPPTCLPASHTVYNYIIRVIRSRGGNRSKSTDKNRNHPNIQSTISINHIILLVNQKGKFNSYLFPIANEAFRFGTKIERRLILVQISTVSKFDQINSIVNRRYKCNAKISVSIGPRTRELCINKRFK